MTTEKKAASKAVPSKASNTTTAKPKATPVVAKRPSRRTTTTKAPVKRKAATKTQAKPQASVVVKTVSDKKTKAEKKGKSGKVKMERDSFTMPKDEYAQFSVLKSRLLALGRPAKKSELLRAGIKLLSGMTDLRLKKAMADVPIIKTGRPKKKK